MWKSRRIASAQDCCRKKRESKQAEVNGETDDGCPSNGSAIDEEEEKSRLVSCTDTGSADGLCYYRNPSYLCRLPSQAAMAGREFTFTLRTFLACHLKKFPGTLHLRSYCNAVKRKCVVSLKGPAMCIPLRNPFNDKITVAEVCLIEFGIHIRESTLLSHRRFSLHEIRMATSHFAEKNVLGKGSSGCVYRGELASTGESIAVKLLNVRSKDARLSFSTELEVLRGVSDHHVQPLLGYCIEDGVLLLVYTYLPKGSLEAMLHGVNKRSNLSWLDRCKVAFGITKALHYLHTCNPPIIHRDIKPSNILLTPYNEAKLTDFGLAIKASSPNFICKDIVGTFGYLSPEYFEFGRVSTKMDIYSLGVVLLELMTGRCPIDSSAPPGQGNLAVWARHLAMNMQNFTVDVADPVLGTSYSSTGMQRLLYVAVLCIHPLDSRRPSISKVLDFMQEEPTVRLQCLVMEAYKDTIHTFPSVDQDKGIRESADDLRKRYMKTAMQEVEERNFLLSSPLIDL